MKQKLINKIIFSIGALFLSLCLSLSPQKASAALWPAVDPIIKTQLETVMDQIKGVIMGAAKTAAVQALNQEMNSLISGSSVGGAMFIVDWRDYLIRQPAANAQVYFNSYLDQVTRGRGSMTNYIPNNNIFLAQNSEGVGPNAFSQGLAMDNPAYGRLINSAEAAGLSIGPNSGAGNYINQLVESAKSETTEKTIPQVTYVGDPSQMFAQGNFRNMNLYFSGINNPWAFNLNAQQEYQKLLTEEEKIASDKARSYSGFTGTIADGKVITPGSLVKENVANIQDLGNKVIANAQHIPEVLTAIVSQMITRSIQQGIGEIKSQVNREVSNVSANAQSQINQVVQKRGPGELYR